MSNSDGGARGTVRRLTLSFRTFLLKLDSRRGGLAVYDPTEEDRRGPSSPSERIPFGLLVDCSRAVRLLKVRGSFGAKRRGEPNLFRPTMWACISKGRPTTPVRKVRSIDQSAIYPSRPGRELGCEIRFKDTPPHFLRKKRTRLEMVSACFSSNLQGAAEIQGPTCRACA